MSPSRSLLVFSAGAGENTLRESRESSVHLSSWSPRSAGLSAGGQLRMPAVSPFHPRQEYQEFKRAWKQAMRKEEIERIKVSGTQGC